MVSFIQKAVVEKNRSEVVLNSFIWGMEKFAEVPERHPCGKAKRQLVKYYK